MVSTRSVMLIAVIIMGIYVLPSVIATFAGSHTIEYNQTGVAMMDCGACHQYIVNELGATNTSMNVLNAHIAARANSTYTDNVSGWVKIGANTTPVTASNVCPLCHAAQAKITGAHTQVVTRVCDDEACHGYNGTGPPLVYATAQNVSQKLNSSADMHSRWYISLQNSSSKLVREEGGNYSRGWYSCLGCHTHVGVDLTLTRPSKYNMTLNYSAITGQWTIKMGEPAETNYTTNTSIGVIGSKWS